MAGLNIKAIQRAVVKGIKLYPTKIELKRDNIVSDGYGGYYVDTKNPSQTVASLDVYFNDASSSRGGQSYSDGGRKENISPVNMLVLHEEGLDIQIDDYFELNGNTYIVKYPLKMYEAYWLVDLEVKLDGKQL